MVDEPATILRVLADESRQRIMHLLRHGGALVSELQTVLEIGQSSVSAHLAKLRSVGLLHDVAEGTARRYQLNDAPPALAAKLWAVIQESTAQDPLIQKDFENLNNLRSQEQQSWIERVAGHLDNSYAPGRTWEAITGALLHLCSLGDCCDIGAGDGALLELIAPRCKTLTAIEPAAAMRAAAQDRLKHLVGQVTILDGQGESVPLPDANFDTVLFLQSLQFIEQPQQALNEALRLLRPGGKLLIASLNEHKFTEVNRFGHRHLGFAAKTLENWLQAWQDPQTFLLPAERRTPHYQPIIATATKPT